MRKATGPSPSGSAAAAASERHCEHPGCRGAGLYRAPKSRQNLNDYLWFCLDHVRDYNRAWNYYAGMDESEVEAHIRNDTVWQRPTWPLGSWQSFRDRQGEPRVRFRDPFGFFRDDSTTAEGGAEARQTLPPVERQALTVLELSPPVTLAEIKIRYKGLVKQLHPDANGGDKEAEERLKVINQAYSTLKHSSLF
jgi:hypothetical protein